VRRQRCVYKLIKLRALVLSFFFYCLKPSLDTGFQQSPQGLQAVVIDANDELPFSVSQPQSPRLLSIDEFLNVALMLLAQEL
jgi:hypothetical protein